MHQNSARPSSEDLATARLLSHRVVRWGGDLGADMARTATAHLLTLALDEPRAAITLLLDPAGEPPTDALDTSSLDGAWAVHDLIAALRGRSEVTVVLTGPLQGPAVAVLAAAAAGRRFALPHVWLRWRPSTVEWGHDPGSATPRLQEALDVLVDRADRPGDGSAELREALAAGMDAAQAVRIGLLDRIIGEGELGEVFDASPGHRPVGL